MFFLFSDVLLYTSRGASGTSRLRTRGLLPLRGMLKRHEELWGCPAVGPALPLSLAPARSSRLEKEKWMRDLNAAIEAAKSSSDTALAPPDSVPCARPHSEFWSPRDARGSLQGQGQRRATTTVHVCWHRSTSVSRADRSAAVENQLSGYLLRKLKNSSGWQRLWVVVTNFCLFFYKTHQDDHPLASLPLLGYRVSVPGEADGVHKECAFKLQFRSHVYFFRAESRYSFRRWMEAIESASSSPGRAGAAEEEAAACSPPSPARDGWTRPALLAPSRQAAGGPQ
uniref:PH domain-containing protein n=1 Tax=Catagonus wagneri TaxID=51154 RepID=A0A8C3YJR4_9CETA